MIEVAEHFGPPLTSFRRKVDLSSIGRWTSLTEPGWRVGGELSLSCPECTRSLHWWDWTHASAPARSNTYVVACDRHGVVNKALRKPSELIMARRVLDSLEWAHAGTAAYQVYAFELQGVGHRQVYVGQTHRTVEERLVDHHDAARAVKAVRRGGVVGRFLQIPQLPPISHWRTALAAERWVAAHFEFRGFTVHGDGRR